MNKNDLAAKPLPSYILYMLMASSCMLHIPVKTCKYCGEKGHFQAKCDKRLNDFPKLVQQSNNRVIFQYKPYSYKTEFELRKKQQAIS